MMSSEDQKDRMLSTMRLYPEKSEGFQGAGGEVRAVRADWTFLQAAVNLGCD